MGKISKLLALETTDVSGSVALCEDGQIVAFKSLPSESRSAQSLAPTLRAILTENGWRPGEVEAVAVAVGPGSFTGLRVGVATAKMFAWAVGARAIAVDALDAIVGSYATSEERASVDEPAILSVGIDAQRGDAAVRYYLLLPDASEGISLNERFHVMSMKRWFGSADVSFMETLSETVCDEIERRCRQRQAESGMDVSDVLARATMKDVIFMGPALRRMKALETTHPWIRRLPDELGTPDASGVARVGWQRCVEGIYDDVMTLAPIYSRRAAAEEKALEKQRATGCFGTCPTGR